MNTGGTTADLSYSLFSPPPSLLLLFPLPPFSIDLLPFLSPSISSSLLPLSGLFSLNHNSGQLIIREGAPVPVGSYSLEVRVSDKTWPDVISTAEVVVMELDEEAVQNAGSLRLSSECFAPLVYQPIFSLFTLFRGH